MKFGIAMFLALVAFLNPAMGQEKLPVPATMPATQPFVPEWESSFFAATGSGSYKHYVPGARIWRNWLDGNVWHYGTTQSVGDGAAMYVYSPAGDKPGWLWCEDTGAGVVKDKDGKVLSNPMKDYKGLSVWIKGDGSDGQAVFSVGYPFRKHKFFIPLKDTNWHKVYMPWDKWTPGFTENWGTLLLSLDRKDNSSTSWYIIDRIHFYKEEKTEDITPTPDNDPPGMLPAKAFVSGTEHISKTLAKLKEKKPVKIVVAGDSLVTCAQMGYVRKNYNYPMTDMHPYGFWWVAGKRVAEHYGYKNPAMMLRTWDNEKKAWHDATTRPAGDIEVFAVAKGGWTSKHGLDEIKAVLDEKPDLVIWEYGFNDVTNPRGNSWKYNEQAFDILKQNGIEVVAMTVTTSCEYTYPRGTGAQYKWALKHNDMMRKVAVDKKVAMADVGAAVSARGPQFMGDLNADYAHLNHLGHEIFADVLDALLTGRDVRTWTHGPAADKVRASTQPATQPALSPATAPK